MERFHVPDVEVPETGLDDPRVGQFLTNFDASAGRRRVAIIGCPSEEGLKLRGDRVGAAEGPDAIREALYRMTLSTRGHEPFRQLLLQSEDLGNLAVTGNLEEDQELLGEVVAELLAQKTVPIILGGGQSVTYGHFLGYVKAAKQCNMLGWDSRLDVQEFIDGKGSAGSTLRQAITHPSGICQRCEVAGLLAHANSKPHLDFFKQRAGTVIWRSELTESRIDEIYGWADNPMLASFDLNGVDQAQAPGVTRPSVNGIPIDLWLYAARRAGEMLQVSSMDLVGLSPAHDIDRRTARLAALTIWTFLKGMARRFR
jgi:formiminoglutamase